VRERDVSRARTARMRVAVVVNADACARVIFLPAAACTSERNVFRPPQAGGVFFAVRLVWTAFTSAINWFTPVRLPARADQWSDPGPWFDEGGHPQL
jgi:hypothetical protein